MATTITTTCNVPRRGNAELPHRLRLTFSILVALGVILWLAVLGSGYYRLDLAERAESPKSKCSRMIQFLPLPL